MTGTACILKHIYTSIQQRVQVFEAEERGRLGYMLKNAYSFLLTKRFTNELYLQAVKKVAFVNMHV